MKIIDCHHHLDRGMVSLPGLLASMDAAGIERVALIASLNPPLSLPRFAGPLLLAQRLFLAAQAGGPAHSAGEFFYRRMVHPDGTVDLLGQTYEVKTQPRNDEVLEAVQAHPDRFLGWIFVNPMGPLDPADEIERCRRVPGMIGVKAHPYWHDYSIERLLDTAARCQELGLPMLIHLGAGRGGNWRLLPEQFPRLKIIYAHAGVPCLRQVCAFAATTDRVFVDLSSTTYVDLRTARLALQIAGVDSCLFGTDGPYFHDRRDRFDFSASLRVLNRLGLSDADWEKVAARNFLEVIGRG